MRAGCVNVCANGWRNQHPELSYRRPDPAVWARTIRGGHWRYPYFPTAGGEQFFCLAADSDETKGLAHYPDFAEIRLRMCDCLLEAVVLQDHPHTPRSLYQLGVH